MKHEYKLKIINEHMVLNGKITDKNDFIAMVTKNYNNRVILDTKSYKYLFMIYKSAHGNWIVKFSDSIIQRRCNIGLIELYQMILKIVSKKESAILIVD